MSYMDWVDPPFGDDLVAEARAEVHEDKVRDLLSLADSLAEAARPLAEYPEAKDLRAAIEAWDAARKG